MATSLTQRFCRISTVARMSTQNCRRPLSTTYVMQKKEPDFGIMFDIDGVIVRGKKVLPFSPKAFNKLVDQQGKFRVPTIFLTNAGNVTRLSKAEQLSSWLGVDITEEQVVMAHSPLKMFHEYHSKHVLVVGQGPVGDIATNNGFQNVTTIEDLRHAFPSLDAVDHKRRRVAVCSFEEYFPPLDAVVLFGEPIRWETSLQLIVDVLVSNGHPAKAPKFIPYPHIPVLACNMDLQWMAEAVMPRFGHGAFLLCLENLYKKITGRDLIYTALIGKPSEITYIHGEHVLQNIASQMGLTQPVKTIYCIGDNICTDIFGANLYNRYLRQRREISLSAPEAAEIKMAASAVAASTSQIASFRSRSFDQFIGFEGEEPRGADQCISILVETGVYSPDGEVDHQLLLNHSPRDFLPVEKSHQIPTHVVENVLNAVDLIFEKQNFI